MLSRTPEAESCNTSGVAKRHGGAVLKFCGEAADTVFTKGRFKPGSIKVSATHIQTVAHDVKLKIPFGRHATPLNPAFPAKSQAGAR